MAWPTTINASDSIAIHLQMIMSAANPAPFLRCFFGLFVVLGSSCLAYLYCHFLNNFFLHLNVLGLHISNHQDFWIEILRDNILFGLSGESGFYQPVKNHFFLLSDQPSSLILQSFFVIRFPSVCIHIWTFSYTTHPFLILYFFFI